MSQVLGFNKNEPPRHPDVQLTGTQSADSISSGCVSSSYIRLRLHPFGLKKLKIGTVRIESE